MSETSSNNSEHNVERKKNVSYSTDYMVDLLKVSEKVVSPSKRKGYEKNVSDISDNRSAISNSSDINTYITDEKINKNTDSNVHSASASNSHSNISDSQHKSSENIFAKTFVENKNNQGFNGGNNSGGQESNPPNTNTGVNPDVEYDNYNELSPEAQMLKKLELLRKLGELTQYGVKLSQNYSMSSDYFTMKYEHQLHTNIRSKQNFINWTSSIMLNCIYGMEILNDKYDPFSLKLTNWSQQINADISSYYDVFGEIYEKYNKPGKSMSPELKLVLMIGGSALKFHLNQVAAQGKIGPIGMMGGALMGNQSYSNQNMSNQNNINAMREQAQLQKNIEETKKQNEYLSSKSQKEHELANQQMKDMMYLQKKQEELAKQELIRKKQMEEFEKTKAMFEQQKIQQMQQTQQAQQAMHTQFHPNQYNQYNQYNQNGENINPNSNQNLTAHRLENIANQLGNMKNSMIGSNSGLGMNMGLTREQIEQPAHVLYRNAAPNVKRRSDTIAASGSKSNLNVDTSSEISKRSKQSKQSKYSKKDDETNESNESGESERSERSEQSANSSTNSSVSSEASNSEPKNSKIEKSLSSRNNFSSISKRKYKKSGISIDTS